MNRIAEARSIAVVRTRLPYTDRRSLSQAWFSALHLTEGTPAPSSPRGAAAASAPAVREAGRPPAQPHADRLTPAARGGVPSPAQRSGAGAVDVGPRAAPARARTAPDARRTPVRGYAPFRTSLTFGVAGERVALLLRREGTTLHVVALCRPAVENAVRDALALAGAHVRLQGHSLRAAVRALPREQP